MENYGTVKIFNAAGWGFIDQDRNPKDIYFQRDNLKGGHTPQPGDRVSYLVKQSPQGPRAVKVRILDAGQADETNWFEFIHVQPFPLRKLQNDQAASREEKIASARKASSGLR